MANPQLDIFSNSASIAGIFGYDASENTQPLSSLTATLDDYTNGYLTVNSSSQVSLWKRNTFQGTKTVNITFKGKDANGVTLPDYVYSVDMVNPAPPVATHVKAGSFSTHNTNPAASDPGSPTVTMI